MYNESSLALSKCDDNVNTQFHDMILDSSANSEHYYMDIESRMLEISYQLQTTLDIDRLIKTFFTEINSDIQIDGLVYENPIIDKSTSTGKIGPFNSCCFDLSFHSQGLGFLQFLREKPFTDIEIHQLETLSCSIMYPLSNAIQYEKAKRSVFNDPLTGVRNQITLHTELQHILRAARKKDETVSLLHIEIDQLRDINIKFDKSLNEQALKSVAKCIEPHCSEEDISFRYGNNQFIVVLSNKLINEAANIAEAIRINVAESISISNTNWFKHTISCGIVSFELGETYLTLLDRASDALRQAKIRGRNCIHAI